LDKVEKMSCLYNNLRHEADQSSEDLDLKERQLFEYERISADQRNQIEQLQSQYEKEKLCSISLLEENADMIEKWEKQKAAFEEKTTQVYALEVVGILKTRIRYPNQNRICLKL